MKTKLILLVVSIACLVASCGNGSAKKTPDTASTTEAEQPQVVEKKETTPIPENLSDEPVVEIQTSMGVIKVKLYKDTPIHRNNFIKLVSEGFYNDVLFHRVIKDFMIQVGDPESVNAAADARLGNGGPGYNLTAEIVPNRYHKKGVLAAARRGDDVNPEKESSGSQFYIVQGRVWTDEELDNLEMGKGIKFTQEQRNAYKTVGGTPHLDTDYTVFGEVVDGLAIVDAIAAVTTGAGDRPVSNVKISKTIILE